MVVGRNQNPWQECQVGKLQEEGGYLARRLSGGGAVYHDLGNLNFTFLLSPEDFDVERQIQVIRRAAASYGLQVEQTGRNDIVIQGRKFSGNAFYRRRDAAYHHGTILIQGDMGRLTRYLQPDPRKLLSKGVRSVEARVANLCHFCPSVTVPGMAQALREAMAQVYLSSPEDLCEEDLDREAIAALQEKYASWQWRFGAKIPFTNTFEGRFPWGGIRVDLAVDRGVIAQASLTSDAMDSGFITRLEEALQGRPYRQADLMEALSQARGPRPLAYEAGEDQIRDLQALIRQQNL